MGTSLRVIRKTLALVQLEQQESFVTASNVSDVPQIHVGSSKMEQREKRADQQPLDLIPSCA